MSQVLVIKDAGVPGAPNSYYSEEKALSANGDDASPPVAAYTLLPDIGFIFFADLPGTLSVVIRTVDGAEESPPVPSTYVTLIAASGQGQLWSDGSNIFIANSAAPASPELEAEYFVLAQKP